MGIFIQQVFNGLTVGGIYALIALGYTMVYGVMRLINFAHGDLCILGAFIGLTFLTGTAGSGHPGAALLLLAFVRRDPGGRRRRPRCWSSSPTARCARPTAWPRWSPRSARRC